MTERLHMEKLQEGKRVFLDKTFGPMSHYIVLATVLQYPTYKYINILVIK